MDKSRSNARPPISKLILHNQDGEAQFLLSYDIVDGEVKFQALQSDSVTDILIDTKSKLTTEKGVEAFGTFVAGANDEVPVYRHLLSIYIPQLDSSFKKFHITLDDSLEHTNLENSLLFAAETYSVLFDPITEFLESNNLTVSNYPLLEKFFRRRYTFDPYAKLLNGKNIDGTDLDDSSVIQARESLQTTLQQYQEYLTAADLSIMTITGAIIAHKQFLDDDLQDATLHQMTNSSINSPGIYTSDGKATMWFPFTKNKVGKVNRAISTTLNTLSYASTNRDMKEQVQTNIAHKFHDLVDIVSAVEQVQTSALGLQTNVGNLVCALGFVEDYQNDMATILEVSRAVSTKVKQYGQAILAHVAKRKRFDPITS